MSFPLSPVCFHSSLSLHRWLLYTYLEFCVKVRVLSYLKKNKSVPALWVFKIKTLVLPRFISGSVSISPSCFPFSPICYISLVFFFSRFSFIKSVCPLTNSEKIKAVKRRSHLGKSQTFEKPSIVKKAILFSLWSLNYLFFKSQKQSNLTRYSNWSKQLSRHRQTEKLPW